MSFDEIYIKYKQQIFRLCMGYTNDIDSAKDMVQETFIIVWKNLDRFRNESSHGTWIYRIAVNNCLRHIEKEKKFEKSDMPKVIAEEIYDDKFDDKVKFLYKCISELNESERIIISLVLEAMPQSQIASIIGLSEVNVRVRIHRIKEKLANKFKTNEQF
ncbi:MAG: RNA polymerase sigma factor [bacterium]|nr:RNA polymerase sigma factor [bacterium]